MKYSGVCKRCGASFGSDGSRQKYCSPICTIRDRLSIFIDPTVCWPWPGARWRAGYGQIRADHRLLKTHRLAYETFIGPVPDGLYVCHTCDNPPCCNPAHLFLGSHDDNMADMTSKGRRVLPVIKRGAEHPNARLTPAAVVDIRSRVSAGDSMRSVARRYNVAPEAVRRIVRRQMWAHVP